LGVVIAEVVDEANANIASGWPRAAALSSERLSLEPLMVDHAGEMAAVISSTEAELRVRYARQVVGQSPDGSAGWLNWVVRAEGVAVGTVQATLTRAPELVAELAWVVAPGRRGAGVASEAAGAVLSWLRGEGVARFIAHIAPANLASAGVARRLAMRPTPTLTGGEVRWELT
jgi:RimJ/RimL family protein N-acetyltransferase